MWRLILIITVLTSGNGSCQTLTKPGKLSTGIIEETYNCKYGNNCNIQSHVSGPVSDWATTRYWVDGKEFVMHQELRSSVGSFYCNNKSGCKLERLRVDVASSIEDIASWQVFITSSSGVPEVKWTKTFNEVPYVQCNADIPDEIRYSKYGDGEPVRLDVKVHKGKLVLEGSNRLRCNNGADIKYRYLYNGVGFERVVVVPGYTSLFLQHYDTPLVDGVCTGAIIARLECD